MERSLWIPVCKHIKDEKFLPFDQNHWLQQLSKVINSTGKSIGTNNIFFSLLKCVVFPSVTNVSVCKTSRECVLLQKEKLPKMLLWEKWKSMQHHSGCYQHCKYPGQGKILAKRIIMQFQLATILRAEIASGTKKGKYALKEKKKLKRNVAGFS